MSSRSPAVILYDANGVAMAVSDGVAIPAGTTGVMATGTDSDGVARFLSVDDTGALATQLPTSVLVEPLGGPHDVFHHILQELVRIRQHLSVLTEEENDNDIEWEERL